MNRYKTRVIVDVISTGINAIQEAYLLNCFSYAMKQGGGSRVPTFYFNSSDFETAKRYNCEGFDIVMTRYYPKRRDFWKGEISKGNQHMSVLGSLE